MQSSYVYMHLNGDFVPAGIMHTYQKGHAGYSTFQYGKRYLERPDATPVDPVSLPLSNIEYHTPEWLILFGGIRDAAPDGWGRYLLEKEANKPMSEFDYLVRAGLDRVGALGFGPDPVNGPVRNGIDSDNPSPQEILNLNDLVIAAQCHMDELEIDNHLQAFTEYGSSLGGARPKALANYINKLWVVKFNDKSDRRSETRIEYANMLLAQKCGLSIPDLKHVTLASNQGIFLIERFDRYFIEGKKFRKHFVSGLTMLNEHESYIVQIDINKHSYGALADIIRRYGSSDFIEQDLEELFRRMVFNIICSNSDDHLRNQGFLYDQQTQGWRLSPGYDIVPDLNPHDSLGLGVGPYGRAATFDNAQKGANQFGLNSDLASNIIKEMCESAKNWKDLFVECKIPEREIQKLEKNFNTIT
ncbi:MAG: type II toxin-antitoxin system HipA family toxin [Desulfobacteraceae bacterium]|nr:type II toxin-antitoxin system HipA family toxin [Desulfobacteraceae bacterium]